MAVRHGQLEADEVFTVDLEEDVAEVEILNRDGSAEIYLTVDGSDPEVEGDDCLVLPASICSVTVPSQSRAGTQVKLISAGTPSFTVTAQGLFGFGSAPEEEGGEPS